MNTVTTLLQAIIQKGKDKGLRQMDLAQRAGITPESLSRAKKSGDMRVSTLNDLAHAVGMKLTLAVDKPLVEKIDSGSLFE